MFAFTAQELNSTSQNIHEQAMAAAGKYIIAEAELLSAIMKVDQDQTFKKLGYDHLTPYCVNELKLSEEVAGTFVRVVRKSLEVPSLSLAIEGGLHLTKAKTIASVITPENQTEWIVKAQTLSKWNLEKEVAIANPSAHRSEKSKSVGENRNRIEFELNDETMKLQRRAMDLVSSKMGKTASLADVQNYLLENFIKHEDPIARADRSKFRKLDRSRERSAKSIPANIKHEVYKRDRGCCQAINPNGSLCLKQRWIEIHHIKLKAHGGEDTLENLITLCSSHHRLHHELQV